MPQFESLGGKAASKNWKRSVTHNGSRLEKVVHLVREKRLHLLNGGQSDTITGSAVRTGLDLQLTRAEMESKMITVISEAVTQAINSLKSFVVDQLHIPHGREDICFGCNSAL